MEVNGVNPVLEIKSLYSGYGKTDVLKNVSVKLLAGEIVSIVGANGAGKTTLLRTISKLLPLSSGSINLFGSDISFRRAHEVVALGMAHVPEGRLVFPRMTVRENLELGAYSTKLDSAGVSSIVEEVTAIFPVLNERASQVAGTLSGGEQQMLAISRALMSKPKVLILDEPSMGVAPILVETIFLAIQELNKAGISILLVEQDASAALAISNRGYVMETGQIVLQGPAAELLAHAGVRAAYLGG